MTSVIELQIRQTPQHFFA